MPMTDSGLSSAIKAAIIDLFGTPADPTKLQGTCDAFGKAIVEYIKANAQVTGTVTSGAGAGGLVTGTVD